MGHTDGINPNKPWDATGPVWTVAYRKRTGPVFHRVTNWAGTWDQAEEMARRLMVARLDLQVWYVPTLAYEIANPGHQDNGTILTDTGKRVKIRDNGTLPEGLITCDGSDHECEASVSMTGPCFRSATLTPVYGILTDYTTGYEYRPATADEHQRSLTSEDTGGVYTDPELGSVFVAGGPEPEYDREADYWGQHRGE